MSSTVNSDLNSGVFFASTLCSEPAGLAAAAAAVALGPAACAVATLLP
jgi:hypothetical protein